MFCKKKKTAGRPPTIIRNIQTSQGVVEFNIYDFLTEIKNKPVIWNRMHIDHKNGVILEKNWNIFSRIFVPFLEQLAEEEKTKIIGELKDYWSQLKTKLMANILSAQKGQSQQCHYLHYMEFFLKSKKRNILNIATKEELKQLVENEIKFRAILGLPPPTKINDKSPQNKKINKSSSSKTVIVETSSKPSGIEHTFDYFHHPRSTNVSLPRFANEREVIVSFEMTNKSDDANQAFFDSIKPTLRNLNDSQKLDFKIEVLETLKKYKLY